MNDFLKILLLVCGTIIVWEFVIKKKITFKDLSRYGMLPGTIINEEDWQVIRNEEDKRISRVIVRRVLKTKP